MFSLKKSNINLGPFGPSNVTITAVWSSGFNVSIAPPIQENNEFTDYELIVLNMNQVIWNTSVPYAGNEWVEFSVTGLWSETTYAVESYTVSVDVRSSPYITTVTTTNSSETTPSLAITGYDEGLIIFVRCLFCFIFFLLAKTYCIVSLAM